MPSQTYRSTRATTPQAKSFEYAVIRGLAEDGGLFVPSTIPKLPSDFAEKWADLSFEELAFNLMSLYVSREEIPAADLKNLIAKSYSKFRAPEITPLVKIDSQPNLHLLELFHGPTYAFKDVALQFLGNLFEYFLQKKNSGKSADQEHDKITVVGATSGDTGSAAIYGLRNKKDVSVFILYPTGRVSPLQEQQMTTVQDANIHTLSVKGTFDDCQALVKQVFKDDQFNDKYHIGAVNSINWARILAQITYYFHAYFQLLKQTGSKSGKKVKFVVPSGNFGDILAGYYAREMGLPVEKLVVATNENDILNRFLHTGVCDKAPVKATYSPAMDISVSSNFERFLWYMIRDTVAGKDDNEAGKVMAKLQTELAPSSGVFKVAPETLKLAQSILASGAVTNEETVETIRATYENTSNHYILDPHSAVGITVAERTIKADGKTAEETEYVSLSTAHPAKFSEVVNKALGGIQGYSFEKDVLPEELAKLSSLPKKIKTITDVSLKAIEDAIVEELAQE